MPKKPARELVDGEVKFISLVKSPANQKPFTILKHTGDSTMSIDLTRVIKGEPPAVAFVAIAKSLDQEVAVKAIEASGLKAGEPQDGKSAFIYKQADDIPEDTTLFRVNDDIVVGVAGMSEIVEKAFEGYSFNETDFKTLMTHEGAIPMIHIAKDVLGAAIHNILINTQSRDEAKAQVQKAGEAFTSYVTSVIGNVPEHAFKFADSIAELMADQAEAREARANADADGPIEGEDPADQATETEATDAAADASDNDTAATEPTADDGGDKQADAATAADAEPSNEDTTANSPAMPDLDALVSQISEQINQAVATAVKPITEQVSDVQKAVGEVGARVKDTENALASTIKGAPTADERELETVEKADANGAFSFDTAFSRKI